MYDHASICRQKTVGDEATVVRIGQDPYGVGLASRTSTMPPSSDCCQVSMALTANASHLCANAVTIIFSPKIAVPGYP